MLHLLLLNVVLCLLHIYKHLFKLLMLFISIREDSGTLYELSNFEERLGQRLYLEVYYCTPYLYCFSLCQAQREAPSYKDKGSKLGHVILEVESIILETNHCMLP
jgi:hypothetical protein